MVSRLPSEISDKDGVSLLLGVWIVLPLMTALAFWFPWTVCNIGEDFFWFLPPVWQNISYWNCVGMALCLTVIRSYSPFRGD